MTGLARAKLPRVLELLPLVPALAALVMILSFANEVPYGDEWDTPGRLLTEIAEGEASWKHFVTQHNESRKVVPRVIFALGTLLFGWRVIPYMVLGWLFVLVTMLLLLKMLAGDRRDEPGWLALAGLLVASLLFSPIQAENQLWGIQMIVFIPPLCLVASLWVQSTKISYRHVVLWCALFSLIATYSFANGMLCWLLAFPWARYWLSAGGADPAERRSGVRVSTAIYVALAAASILLYFVDYQRPSHHPSMRAVLEDPALGVGFFATWIGSPFASALGNDLDSATALGTFLLLMLCLVAAWIVRGAGWRAPRQLWLPYYPWICLTVYGIVSGLVTTAGRSGFGREQATAGRYSTFALWVAIGLAGMVTVLWRSPAGRRLGSARLVSLLVGATLCYLAMETWREGPKAFERVEYRTRQYLLTLRLLRVAPANPLIGCPRPECLYTKRRKVVRQAAALDEAGVLAVEFIGSWLPDALRSPAASGVGEYRITSAGVDQIRIVGWAALPGADRAPDFVAVARRRKAGRLVLVSGLIMKDRLHRWATPEVGTELEPALFGESLAIPFSDAGDLRVFAVDLSSEKVHELSELGPHGHPGGSTEPVSG